MSASMTTARWRWFWGGSVGQSCFALCWKTAVTPGARGRAYLLGHEHPRLQAHVVRLLRWPDCGRDRRHGRLRRLGNDDQEGGLCGRRFAKSITSDICSLWRRAPSQAEPSSFCSSV